MATRTYQTGRFALEVAGSNPAFAESVSLPSRVFPAAGAPSLGSFEARVAVSEAGTLLDWVMSLARRQVVESAGSVVVTNANLDRQRRFDWLAGTPTRLQLSTLDAAASKVPFVATFQWQPAELSTAKDSGKLVGALAKKQKMWLCSNFKIEIGGLPDIATKVVKVELPTVTGKATPRAGNRRRVVAPTVEFGPLRLTVSAAGIDAARDWVQGIVKQGGVLPGDLHTVSIEMLDAALSKTLGTIVVEGCSLQAWDEAPLESANSSLRTAVLTFAVQGMDLKVSA